MSLLGNPAVLLAVTARLFLDMKKAGAKNLSEGARSSAPEATISGIIFAAPSSQIVVSHIDKEGEIRVKETDARGLNWTRSLFLSKPAVNLCLVLFFAYIHVYALC